MRGRGIDFEHRFNTSRWAEDLLIQALGQRLGFRTVRFGLSAVRPDDQLVYGETTYKEPDLLTFVLADLTDNQKEILRIEDLETADRGQFDEGHRLHFVFEKALAAIEVEFSPYRAKEMKDRDWVPRTLERWNQRPLKRANPPTAPNIIVKEEDLPKLAEWQEDTDVPIVIVHLFDQEAFAVTLDTLRKFDERYTRHPAEQTKQQITTGIFKTVQTYDRVDAQGAAEKKTIFRVTPAAGIKVGNLEQVTVASQLSVSSSKKYVTHPIFSGGRLTVSEEFLQLLRNLR
jgi:hypothetical protein